MNHVKLTAMFGNVGPGGDAFVTFGELGPITFPEAVRWRPFSAKIGVEGPQNILRRRPDVVARNICGSHSCTRASLTLRRLAGDFARPCTHNSPAADDDNSKAVAACAKYDRTLV